MVTTGLSFHSYSIQDISKMSSCLAVYIYQNILETLPKYKRATKSSFHAQGNPENPVAENLSHKVEMGFEIDSDLNNFVSYCEESKILLGSLKISVS